MAKEIAIVWNTDDVHQQAEDMGIRISERDAENILDRVEANHDASIGVSWDVIDCNIDMYMNTKSKQPRARRVALKTGKTEN